MRQGKLQTSTFTIICPHCQERQLSAGGSHVFRAREVKAGMERSCTNKECKKQFKLPPKLSACVKYCA